MMCQYQRNFMTCDALGYETNCPYSLKDLKLEYESNLGRGGYFVKLTKLSMDKCKVFKPGDGLEDKLLKEIKEQLDKTCFVDLKEILK